MQCQENISSQILNFSYMNRSFVFSLVKSISSLKKMFLLTFEKSGNNDLGPVYSAPESQCIWPTWLTVVSQRCDVMATLYIKCKLILQSVALTAKSRCYVLMLLYRMSSHYTLMKYLG